MNAAAPGGTTVKLMGSAARVRLRLDNRLHERDELLEKLKHKQAEVDQSEADYAPLRDSLRSRLVDEARK